MMEKRGRRKRKRRAPAFTVGKSDPLFRIFEKHLYEFNYETRDNFITTVVREYLAFLVQERKVMIPASRRTSLESAIAEDVSDMLVRKIYGCLQVEDDGVGEEQGKQKGEVKPVDSELVRAITNENEAAALTPADIKKRLTKLIR